MANSFPKSGTHLLLQILESIPGLVNYGTFIASMPSVTFRERTAAVVGRKLGKIAYGELAAAHLFYSPNAEAQLKAKNVAHYLIHRDPRDVAVSEAFYLKDMNRWHRLHPFYKALSSDAERIMFAIKGGEFRAVPYDYPNIKERFERYAPWLTSERTFGVRYEELMGEERFRKIVELMEFFCAQAELEFSAEQLAERAAENITPAQSHTFRAAKIGGWRDHFTDDHKQAFKGIAGNLLIELGYEKDLAW